MQLILSFLIEYQPCTPNPCKHNGQCKMNKDNFECDCTGTFYRGKTCTRGILVISEVLLVSINQPKTTLEIRGYPDKSIIVTLISSPHVFFEPSKITLTKNKTSSTFTMTVKKSGFYHINYNITGENAVEFVRPGTTLIFFEKANETITKPIFFQHGGFLEEGCFEERVNGKVFLSNLKWSSNKTTNGIVQVLSYGNKTLPLSLTGGKVLPSGNIEAFSITNATEVDDKTRFLSNCSNKGIEQVNIGHYLRTHAFEYSIQVFFNTYSPSWFKLIAALKINEYFAEDLVAELFTGSDMQKKSGECAAGFTFKSNNTYYIHQTKQIYKVLLPNNFIKLPDFSTKCVIIDLNDKHVFFGFSRNKKVSSETSETYEDIFNQFSNALSSVIGFRVISSKLSFEMASSSHILHVVGGQNYSLKGSNVNVGVKYEGPVSFSYNETLKRYKKIAQAEKGLAELSIKFSLEGETQLLKINGFSRELNSYNGAKTNAVAKISLTVSPVKNTLHTANLSKIFLFSDLSPVTMHIAYNVTPLPFLSGIVKSNLSLDVAKAMKTVNNTLHYLKQLSVDKYLKGDLKTLTSSTSKLLNALLSYPTINGSVYHDLAFMRFLFSEGLKSFSVLLNQYIQLDLLNLPEIKLKFMNFKNQHDEFIRNTHVNKYPRYMFGELSDVAVEGKGQVCVDFFCFSQIKFIADIYQKRIYGQFTRKNEIGNYIQISALSMIVYDIEGGSKSINMEGEVEVFNQVKKVNISIQKSFLSFNVDARIGNMDLISLRVEATLDTVLRDDPLHFVFNGNMETSHQLKADIKNALKEYFNKLEKSLDLRKNSIKSSRLSAARLWYEMNNVTFQLREKLEQLKNQLDSVDVNLTITERLIKMQKESYRQAVRQDSNLTANHRQMMLEQCQPKFCNSSCLPALRKGVCRKQRKIYLVDEQCYLQNVTTVSYQHAQKNRIVSTLKYKRTFICWSECFQPKNSFSKGKQQGMVDNLNILIARSVFEKSEDLGELRVGSNVLKDFTHSSEFQAFERSVSSLFGSCYRYCGYDYKPFTTQLTHQKYKKEPMTKVETQDKCESKLQNANGSTESVYGCLSTTPCKNLNLNESCIKAQHECNQIRKSMRNRVSNKSSSTESAFQIIAKSSFIHGLLITKRNLLSQQLQNVEHELEIADAVNKSAYKRYNTIQKSLKLFEDTTKQDRSLIEKFEKKPELFTSNDLKFNFNFFSGMEFPKQFFINVDVFNLSSTVLFDVNNYQKSVRDISLEIKDLVKKMVHTKRQRRSAKGPQANKTGKECLSMQQAEIFILQILEAYKDKLSNFSKMKSLVAERIKVKDKLLRELKVNISNQFSGVLNDSTNGLLNREVNEIFINIINVEKEIFLTGTWNFTLKEIPLELELLTYDLHLTTCVNLLDCLQFYTELMKDMVHWETEINLLNVTEKIQAWKDSILHLILAYPDIKQTDKLVTTVANSVIEVDPTQWFCGNPPILAMLLSDTVYVKEGAILYLKVEILNEAHNYKIIWKRNNHILQGYNTTVLNKTVTKVDEGYYSCEMTNKFGKSNCGRVLVEIFENVKFLIEPQDAVAYLYSPKKFYLTCAVKSNTSDGVFSWFFRPFLVPEADKKPLPVSGPYIEINQATSSSSGFYSCQYNNKLTSAVSREAVVNVLKTTVAVERIRVKIILSKLDFSRDVRTNQANGTEIMSQLSKLMEAKFEEILIKNVSNEPNGKEKIEFVLHGRNLTSYLQIYSWNDLMDKIIKQRRSLLLSSVLLHLHTKNSKNFTAYNKSFVIERGSVSFDTLEPLCPQGQSLTKNGFICGKFIDRSA